MGILDKIKNIFKEEEKNEEIVIENIDFKMLYPKVDALIKDNSEVDGKINLNLDKLINDFIKDAESSLISLERVDISQRKEHEKIKLVVKDNLNLYIANLRRLMDILRNLDEKDIQKKINRLLEAFSEFNRLSNMAFQKATILVGSELADAKNKIKEFSMKFNNIIEENKSFFERSSSSRRLKSLLEEIKSLESREEEINFSIEDYNRSIQNNRNSIGSKNKEIEKIKSSEGYLSDSKEKEKSEKRLADIENSIQRLKNKIDFKLLSKIYHSDNKKNQFIKDYSNSFKSALLKDSDLEILDLIKSGQGIDLSELRDMRSEFIRLKDPLLTETDKKISSIDSEIRGLDANISYYKNEIFEVSKKKDKISARKEELIEEARALAEKTFSNIKII